MDRRRQQRLSLDFLRGFRAAAKHLSFTRAAQELFVTQPAISREIRTLEQQLGVPLFKRVNRALQLTDAGRELLRAADEALGVLDAATERIAGTKRRLSVTTTTALASLWLVPKLPHFMQRHPGIDVRVAASNDMVDIEREQLDLVLRFVPPWMDPPAGDPLIRYAIFPVCAPALRKDRAHPLRTLDDLRAHIRLDFDILLYGKPWSDWDQWLSAMRLPTFAPAGTLHFGHYDQVIQSAISGAGVAIGKWPHSARELAGGTLCAPLGDDAVAWRGAYYPMTRPASPNRDTVAAFLDWLRDEVRADGALDVAPREVATPAKSTRARGRSRSVPTRRAAR
jgi:DNA-binding transcriptional LysR family regulator